MPKLYDLTTLQREANRLFNFTAKQTLDYAQALYKKRPLTYLDSRFLSDDVVDGGGHRGCAPLFAFMIGKWDPSQAQQSGLHRGAVK